MRHRHDAPVSQQSSVHLCHDVPNLVVTSDVSVSPSLSAEIEVVSMLSCGVSAPCVTRSLLEAANGQPLSVRDHDREHPRLCS